jgi:hypothetical protein
VACALNQRALNIESLLSAERELQAWLGSPQR